LSCGKDRRGIVIHLIRGGVCGHRSIRNERGEKGESSRGKESEGPKVEYAEKGGRKEVTVERFVKKTIEKKKDRPP